MGDRKTMTDMDNNEIYDRFEAGLEKQLVQVCTGLGMLGGTLLSSDDIDGKWREFAPEYMARAVGNVAEYPEFSVACAAYAGMAVAYWWDADWGANHSRPFSSLTGVRGFDYMDDNIVVNILGLDLGSKEAGIMKSTVEALSSAVWAFIRRSGIERGTADAFHAFARACKVMYRTGASLELKRLGYSYQAVDLNSGRPLS